MRLFKSAILQLLRRAPLRRLRHRRFVQSSVSAPFRTRERARVLVLGVYLADRPHTVQHIVERMASDAMLEVTHRWTALKGGATSDTLRRVTVAEDVAPMPKFALIDRMMQPDDLAAFDFVIVCDDDIFVPHGFLPAFIAWQRALGFAIAQPARTLNSHFDLAFSLRRPWLRARQTRFVECGPMVSFRADAARLVMPFGADSSLWGLDFVWPEVLGRHGLLLGIVDAVCVDHSLRPQATSYDKAEQERAMNRYLATLPHLSLAEAFVVVRRHWRLPPANPGDGQSSRRSSS